MLTILYLICIGIHHGFGHPLALVVARPGSDGVDVAIVSLVLGVDSWIPVHFRRGRQKKPRFYSLSQAKHV